MHRKAEREQGQALVETSVVILLLCVLIMGIIEFGRVFTLTNMITHAARDGGRFAATLDPSLRNSEGCFTGAGTTAVQDHIAGQLSRVGVVADGIDVVQGCDGDLATVQIALTGTVTYLFGLVDAASFNYNRSVTFSDENRLCDAGPCP